MSRDVSPAPALAVGLWTRALAETTRDTAEWLATAGADAGKVIGGTADEEAELLKTWQPR